MLLAAMLPAGLLTSSIVTSATVENTGAATALFMNSFLSPHLQPLASEDALPQSSIEALNRLLGVGHQPDDSFGQQYPHLDVWKEGGLVVYSKAPDLIGKRFDPPTGLTEALSGDVAARYTDLSAHEHLERGLSDNYLELYVPVREHLSGRIIAVAEIHETPDHLRSQLFMVRLMNWAVIVGVTLLVMISLLGIVVRAGRLIAEQQATLTRHVDEVHKISNQNHELRRRAELASRRLSELNASYLRSVGAELHDGPAQLISLAALKVEQARRAKTALTRLAELRNIHAVLTDALRDIRTISKGLMLPEIEHLPLAEVVRRAIRVHEARTKTTVDLRCGNLDCNVSHATKICVYRFLQEGLSNAVRHAGGMGLTVFCKLEGPRLSVAVRDQGAYDNHGCEFEAGLGLTGLRARVESLGGTFTIASTPDGGTQIEMSLDTEVENDEQDFNSDWGRPFAISRGSRSGAATG